MSNIEDVRAKMPCSLYTIFCITNSIQCAESVEPWYGQIKELADGADKWSSEMHKAVIYGMYPELERASKDFYCRYKDIRDEFKNDPQKNSENLSDSLKELSFQIGEQYCLNQNRYLFNEVTEEQAQRVQKRKDVEKKDMSYKRAEALIDPLHIVMQGMTEKIAPNECDGLMQNFSLAEILFRKENDSECMELGQKSYPEAYSIYKQIKKCLETVEIKDCFQIIDDKNYARFAGTLGSFKYNGKKYNLLDKVKPITQKRDVFGRITEKRMCLTKNMSQQKN